MIAHPRSPQSKTPKKGVDQFVRVYFPLHGHSRKPLKNNLVFIFFQLVLSQYDLMLERTYSSGMGVLKAFCLTF